MKKLRSAFALLLCLVMCLSLFPTSALADELVGDGALDVPQDSDNPSVSIADSSPCTGEPEDDASPAGGGAEPSEAEGETPPQSADADNSPEGGAAANDALVGDGVPDVPKDEDEILRSAQDDEAFSAPADDGTAYRNRWYQDSYGYWYYYGDNGELVYGLQEIDGSWYFFDDYSGRMLADDQCWVYSNGFNEKVRAKASGKLYRSEWYQDSSGNWFYYDDNCAMVRNRSAQSNGNWYLFNDGGVMQKNGVFSVVHYYDDGSAPFEYYRAKADGTLYVNCWYKEFTNYGQVFWYYYDGEGKALIGYHKVGNHYYFFNGSGGWMITNDIVCSDGYAFVIDDNGYTTKLPKNGWTKVDGYWYYCIDGAPMINHVRQIDGEYYGFDGRGRLFVNRIFTSIDYSNNEWYYYHASSNGVLDTNKWGKTDSDKWLYFGANAKAYSDGYYRINGKWYYFDKDGFSDGVAKKPTGWVQSGGKWYFCDSSGTPKTGWKKIGGKWYYFNAGGDMVTGWKKISGKWYYFESSGEMKTGWVKSGSSWYYMDSSGAMLADTSREINGKVYNFNASGVCTNP